MNSKQRRQAVKEFFHLLRKGTENEKEQLAVDMMDEIAKLIKQVQTLQQENYELRAENDRLKIGDV